MAQYELVEISRPDTTALQDAIAISDGKCGQKSSEELMAAGLVIIGEACAQFNIENKTPGEVVESLVARGLAPGIATIWVNKANDVVNDTINKDPEKFLREHFGGISKREIAFYVFALLLAIFIWQS